MSLSLLTTLLCGCDDFLVAPETCENTYYYFAEDKSIHHIKPSNKELLITFDTDKISYEETVKILESYPMVRQATIAASADNFNPSLIEINQPLSCQQLSSLVENLREHDYISEAAPVFYEQADKEQQTMMPLTQDFYVKIKEGFDCNSIETLCKQTNSTIQEEEDNHFTIRSNTASAMGAIDMANYFSTQECVEWAKPKFASFTLD